MSDLLEFAGVSELSDTWGTLKELEYLQDIPLTNLEFWWRADKITTAEDGDAIGTLVNEAGTGNVSQGTLSARAIYRTNQINGMPALDFDGVDDFYIATSTVSTAFSGEDRPFTLYTVYRHDTVAATMWHLSMGRLGGATSQRYGISSAGAYRLTKAADAGDFVAPLTDAGDAQTTPVLRVDLSPGTTWSIWENETSLLSATAFNVTTATLTRFVLGSRYQDGVTSEFFDGKISEVIMYSASHTATQRLLVTNYLKNKYRLYL